MRLLTVIFFLSISIYSQKNHFDNPNYNKIKRAVRKKSSDFHYTKLYHKFTHVNEKMSLKEKRYLYYGYVYQKLYEPFGYTKYRDSLTIYAGKKLNKKNIQKLLVISNLILRKNPFNIEVLTYKAYLLRKNKNTSGYKLVKRQLQIIFDAILSTGDGKTKNTAYHIIFRDHKKAVLKHQKLRFNGIRKTIDKYRIEYLNVQKNKFNIRGVYFNVSAFKIDLKSKR